MKLQDLRGHNLDLIIPISLILLAELLIFFNRMEAGVVVHAINLAALILSSIYVENRLYTSLLLLPLFRLLNVAMPVFFNLTLYTYPLVYAPMFIPIYFIMKERMFSSAEVGITTKGFWIYLPLAITVGCAVGWGEFQVLQPGMILPGFTLENVLKLSIIMIVFVGFIEEFVFRSALQTVLEDRIGPLGGLLSSSLIFGFMHSGYHIPLEVVYVTFAGMAFGVLFWTTKSLPVISLAHGVTNVVLFAVVPFFPGIALYMMAASALIFLVAARWGNMLPDRAAVRRWLREKGQV